MLFSDNCPKCGYVAAAGATTCSNCGGPLTEAQPLQGGVTEEMFHALPPMPELHAGMASTDAPVPPAPPAPPTTPSGVGPPFSGGDAAGVHDLHYPHQAAVATRPGYVPPGGTGATSPLTYRRGPGVSRPWSSTPARRLSSSPYRSGAPGRFTSFRYSIAAIMVFIFLSGVIGSHIGSSFGGAPGSIGGRRPSA